MNDRTQKYRREQQARQKNMRQNTQTQRIIGNTQTYNAPPLESADMSFGSTGYHPQSTNLNATQPRIQPHANSPAYTQPAQRQTVNQTRNQVSVPSAIPTGYNYQQVNYAAPQQPEMRQGPRRVGKKSKNTGLIIAGGAVVFGGMLFMMVAFVVVLMLATPERIPSGVSAAGVDIGGQSVEDATAALQALPDPIITLVDGTRGFNVRLSELGASVDVAATLALAKNARANSTVPTQIAVDLALTQQGLVGRQEEINVDAVPGNPPQIGRSMEIPTILDRLRLDATGELSDGVFELNMIEVIPPDPVQHAIDTNQTTTHIVEAGQELALIARMYGVTLDDLVRANNIADVNFIYPGQQLIVPAVGEYIPPNIPAASRANGKSIVIDTGEQRIYAYENGQMIRTHLVSTGLPATPTLLGDFSIYVKHVATDMSGPGYFLPQVPFTMYYDRGYGIHGTYWHNSFGRQMSHGCTNLPTPEAQWFFNWAEVGTPVRVI